MPRKGRQLEQLVELIERSIGQRDNVSVESPKYLPDLVTGEQREFDVVVTIKGGHHEVMIGIECKDWGRPVDVPAVEQFAAKCDGTPVHHHVMVSASGFTGPAETKAKANKIRCLTLREVERFDWCLTNVVQQLHRSVSEIAIQADLLEPPTNHMSLTLFIGDRSGRSRPMSTEELIAHANDRLDRLPPTLPDDDRRVFKADVLDPSRIFFMTDDGKRVAVRSATLRVKFNVEMIEVPLAFREYVDVGAGQPISRVAFAPVSVGGRSMQVALVQDKDGDIRVVARMEPGKDDD